MIAKALLAGVLALALEPIDFGPTIVTHHPYVERVFCNGGTGTAFKVASGQWVTVSHVSDNQGCTIDGKPVTVIENDAWGDFSIIDFPDNRQGGIEVNCQGFQDRQWYFGMGYGKGVPQFKAVRHSTVLSFLYGRRGWAILEANRFVPGMSGGPVFDQTGRVVGTVNAYGIFERISFSLPLSGTSLCK